MSTTTQILFNSPALHSLKRDQLVKLCKIHSIKASGKNGDLIVKLQQHARTLPNDAPLSVAFRSEDSHGYHVCEERDEDPEQPVSVNKDDSHWRTQMSRPSEQWEVMESIQEESSSQGTLSSLKTVATGEFGTGSSKATSVSSSIKALATSLGLKRNVTGKSSSSTAVSLVSPHSSSSRVALNAAQDELTRHAIPYASLPASNPATMPQTDHFTFSTPDTSMTAQSSAHDTSADAPIPGHSLRPGLPAPSNARLSAGGHAGNTTTIRLVTAAYPSRQGQPSTPQLRPFETTFDLVAGSPFGAGKMNVWPREDTEKLYPALPEFDVPAAATAQPDASDEDQDVAMPGALGFSMYTPETKQTRPSAIPNDIFSPGPRQSSNTNPTTPLGPPIQPFIFGSPLPQHNLTNTQFRSAAASVLDEMNKRLAGEGVTGVGMDILDFSKRNNRGPELGGNLGMDRKMTAGERFDRMHEQEFEKMDSIANHYAAKRDSPERPKKRKSSVLDGVGEKRRPSGVRPAGTRVISHGARRKMVIPGGFGAEEVEAEEEGGRRESKRPKVEGDVDEQITTKEKRVSIAPPSPRGHDASPEGQNPGSEKEERQKQKEREAIRRKLELNKARRRSSMGRVSVGGGKAPLIPNQKAKGTTSRFGFLSSAKSMMQSVWNRGTSKSATSSIPVSKPAPKASDDSKVGPPLLKKAPPARPSSAINKNATSAGSVASTSSRLLKPTVSSSSDKGTVSSNRSRSPIPSFPSLSSSAKSGMGSVSSSRTGSSIGLIGSRAGSSRFSTRTSSVATASSIGTRSSSGLVRSGSRVSSLGTRGSLASAADAGSAGAKRARSAMVKSGSASSIEARKKATTSRLMAPTASSLARTQSISRPVPMQEQTVESKISLPAVVEDRPTIPSRARDNITAAALDQITNSPAVPGVGVPQYQSPRPGGIFSRPLAGPSSIPTPVRNPAFAATMATVARTAAGVQSPVTSKPKAAAGRKPRISRSRVIARLASQREASATGIGGTTTGLSSGRTRSSLGTAKRQSVGGGRGGRGAGASGVMMSAKKRARQSEYARRRSRVTGGVMDVDI